MTIKHSPGCGCCGTCTIEDIDFSETGWESSVTVSVTPTQTSTGIKLPTTETLTLNAIANSQAPFAVILEAESDSSVNLLKHSWRITEDATLKEAIYVEAASAADLAQGYPSLSYVKRVRINSNGEAYWSTQGASESAAIISNYTRLTIGTDQYWSGDWTDDGTVASVAGTHSIVLDGDEFGGDNPNQRGGAPGLVTSARTAGSTVTLELTNDTSSVDMLIKRITIISLDSPEEDITGRESCVPQIIVCSATADQWSPRWTDCEVDLPTIAAIKLGYGATGCTAAFTRTMVTWPENPATVAFYNDAPVTYPSLELEFSTIQYESVEVSALVQAAASPSNLDVTVTLDVSMLQTFLIKGSGAFPPAYHQGRSNRTSSFTAVYEKTITKPSAHTHFSNLSLTSTDRTSASYTHGGGINKVLASLSHGTGTTTGTTEQYWLPGDTWSGSPDGYPIDGTTETINDTFVDTITLTLGEFGVL